MYLFKKKSMWAKTTVIDVEEEKNSQFASTKCHVDGWACAVGVPVLLS